MSGEFPIEVVRACQITLNRYLRHSRVTSERFSSGEISRAGNVLIKFHGRLFLYNL